MKRYLPHLQILLAGSLWGLIGLFNRNLTAGGLSASSIVVVRNIGGLTVRGLVLLLLDRSVFRIKLRHLPYFFGTGIISILLFTLCYFSAQQMCSLAVAAILLYTAPAFVVVLSALLFHDKLTKGKLAALLLAFLGCTFVSGIWSGGLAVTGWGLVLGVASGFFYGLYSIFGRYALVHYQPLTVTFYTFVFAGAGALFLLKPAELNACLSQAPMLLLTAGLVVVSTVLPYILYTRGLAKIDSGKASILASVEPVVAALVGILVFHEPMSIIVVLGLICILASVYILK